MWIGILSDQPRQGLQIRGAHGAQGHGKDRQQVLRRGRLVELRQMGERFF